MLQRKALSYSYKSIFYIVLASIMFIFGIHISFSQTVLSLDTQIVLLEYENGKLWSLDANTYELNHLHLYEFQLEQILDYEVDVEQDFAYILEGNGCCGAIIAGESLITRINLENNNTEIVFSGRNVFDMHLSPDSDVMLLQYYDNELENVRIAARDGMSRQCFLSLSNGICTEIDYEFVEWITNEIFSANVGEISYLIRTDNLDVYEILVNTLHWTLNPNSNEIIGVFRNTLLAVNPQTFDISSLMLSENISIPNQLTSISFSPDGKSLLFSSREETIIIDYLSGEFIVQLSNVSDAQWINNNNIIFTQFVDLGSYPVGIHIYDIVSEESNLWREFSQRVGYRIGFFSNTEPVHNN